MKKLSRIIFMLFLGLFVATGSVSMKPVQVEAAKKTTVTSTNKKKVTKKSSKSKKLTTKIKNWKAKNLKSLNGVVEQDILNGFKELGFTVTIDKQEAVQKGYAGCFSPSRQKIILKEGDTETLLHELGHFLDFVTDYPSSSKEFKKIFKAEKSKAKSFYNVPSYTTAVEKEYFAEGFNQFYSDPATLKSKCPKTYAYFEKIVKTCTPEAVQYTKNRYGL